MANTFGKDFIIQALDPHETALFYVEQLGFEITDETSELVSLQGKNINMYIERGLSLGGPVLEVTVADVAEATARLVANGCVVIKDEPQFPRTYVQDPMGLIYNLTTRAL
ncbi:MAG TPA: VOC family protein [Rhizomicrobium sp.]|jgi:predicted enzyme related to lactoylglutathione lyase